MCESVREPVYQYIAAWKSSQDANSRALLESVQNTAEQTKLASTTAAKSKYYLSGAGA